MRLLIILRSNFPYPLTTGGQQAVFQMIDYLRNKIDISIAYILNKSISKDHESKLKEKWSNVDFFSYKEPYSEKIGYNYNSLTRISNKILSKIFRRDPIYTKQKIYSGFDSYLPSFLSYILKIIETNKIDIVQIEFFDLMNLVYILPPDIKKVFIQHEIRYIKNKRIFDKRNDCTLLDRLMLNKQKSEEIAAMNHYDSVVTLTNIDKQILLEDGVTSDVISSPACIASIRKKSVSVSYNRISFLGGFNHTPNAEGVLWFLEKVWPIVLAQDESLVFDIIGLWPKKTKKSLEKQYPQIKFHGIVEDLSTILPNSIMVVPILTGSGMRMKILDAINYGCTMVSTSIGCEGLDLIDGKDCYIADKPEVFANKLLTLINNKSLQESFYKNAINWYNNNYTIDILGEKRLAVYDSLK